ncbi:MAG: glycosyltransferase [Acidobacteria bacterium]|nr:glycosyltransferase [Acidobacteriota bacterium]
MTGNAFSDGLLVVGLVFLAFHFMGYPLLVRALARRGTTVELDTDEPFLPTISLIIAAYNEAAVIAGKLENSLALDYPADRLQIVVVSDGSTDETAAIAASFAGRGVVALHDPPRNGKSAALNRGVDAATGEIVVFSDANNDFSATALRALAAHFVDPQLGGACGRKSITAAGDRQASEGDSLYWRYESAIKKWESDLGIMTTADGEIFAVRRELWQPIPPEVINDDAEITFTMVNAGYRIVYEPDAVSSELASAQLEEDFRVKVRMIAGGFQTVARHWPTLLPPRSAFAWAFLAHKLLRWLVPVLLAMVAIGSIARISTGTGAFLVVGQVLFYGIALLGWQARSRGELPRWKYVPLYFSLMNLAALLGLRRFLAGDDVTSIWQKAAR